MNRAVATTIAGTEMTLYFNCNAYLALTEKHGADYLNKLFPEETDTIPIKEWMGAIGTLAEQGELRRRALGYEPREIPDPRDLLLSMQPSDIGQIHKALDYAITAGLRQDFTPEDENDERDLILEELERQEQQKHQ